MLYAVWCLSETVVHIKESKQIRYALRHTTIDVAIDLILGAFIYFFACDK